MPKQHLSLALVWKLFGLSKCHQFINMTQVKAKVNIDFALPHETLYVEKGGLKHFEFIILGD